MEFLVGNYFLDLCCLEIFDFEFIVLMNLYFEMTQKSLYLFMWTLKNFSFKIIIFKGLNFEILKN